MKMIKRALVFALSLLVLTQCKTEKKGNEPVQFSGIYPQLAYYNNEGECGTGAVVVWAGRLWVITYGPHMPEGSSDKLYEVTPDLKQIIRPESLGGTPANRMIHKESNQLFIGPYAIDSTGNVRAIPYSKMFGRHTGNARHLTDPAGKIYYATMEEGFYEVDVKTLDVKTLYTDGNQLHKENEMAQFGPLLPGAHGKGLYSGQGVMVFSNNGEANHEALSQFDTQSGVLAEWNGKDWKVVRRNQFVEVTGPGGIHGNANPATDPIWATGWDHKSVLLGVRDNGKWSFYRLPKASHTYDGAHGWNTEWPRIRDIGTTGSPEYLMTMHGMFWHFPGTFSTANSAGIRPRSAYLKVIGDFTRWNDRLVFGCDDAAHNEFLNKRKAKGGIEGPGQSNSNLWFTTPDMPGLLGPNTAEGAVWLKEKVKAQEPSEPFLFNGWKKRCAWVHNEGTAVVNFTFETDTKGNASWSNLQSVSVAPGEASLVEFPADLQAEWIRVKADKNTMATLHFSFTGEDIRATQPDSIFSGLSKCSDTESNAGLLYGLGNNRRALGFAALQYSEKEAKDLGYYELDGDMNLVKKDDTATLRFIKEKFAIPQHIVSIEESSVLVIDDLNRRWRLPLGNQEYTALTDAATLRLCREVSTERDLFDCHGTFYELPAENADGFAKIRPICSHDFRINDYAGYRGMIIMTGIDPEKAKGNPHVITSTDGHAAVWAGAIDDLWKMGKPVGTGGPWKNSSVKKGVPSDPYLIGFYDKRSLALSHDSKTTVIVKIQVEPIGHGPWMTYKEVSVKPGETVTLTFSDNFQSRWIRFESNTDCKATAWLEYK